MHIVGSHEARARLPELLRSVERGASITITRRGLPIARLVGIDADTRRDTGTIMARMRPVRALVAPPRPARPAVSAEEILSARDAGRRR